MLTIAVTLVALPAANAHTPAWTIPTYAYLSVTPNPVGVGQAVYIGFWVDKVPPTANAQYGDRWHNFTVTVTKPDGSTEKLGPYSSDAVGGAFTTYAPATVGTYNFVFNFPGQTITGDNPGPGGTASAAYVGDYFGPSTSAKVSLTVQQEQIPYYPSTPLPTGYWQRPIVALNLDWYKISGNWLGLAAVSFGATGVYNATENFNPYTTGPNTAHIVWTKPYSFGGMIGGEFGGTEEGSHFMSTSQYEPKFAPIIINGVLYYTLIPGSYANPAGWVAVDIRTGQTLWTKNITTEFLRCGQTLSYMSPNQYGAIPYLWGIPVNASAFAFAGGMYYSMYDAMTGNWILNIVNGTSMTLTEAADGSLIGYYVNSSFTGAYPPTLNMWNSTKCIIGPLNVPAGYPVGWMWRPTQGASIPFSQGIEWSKPIATTIAAPNGTQVPLGLTLSISKVTSDVVLLTATPEVAGYSWNPGYVYQAGYSAIDGHLLWGPINRTQTPWTRVTQVAAAINGIYYQFNLNTQTWEAYSLKTGEKLWGPTAPYVNDTYGYYSQSAQVAYGALYQSDLGGYVHSFNATTGAPLWTFFTGSSGYETPYGEWPLLHIDVVADGKLYVMGGHTYSPPLFRGSNLWCLNATTGDVIWTIPNFPITNGPAVALADGYLIEPNAYDNQLYCYGKGRSATTVTASPKVSVHGDSVLIEGTVTDQSPGQTCLGVPAAGTPAIADAYMTPWMQYLYMQQPMPTNATGVEVTLDTVDPNGNFVHIGTATSDISGNYGHAFVPEVPGLYTLIATFAGSESYYASYAETFINVEEAPQATPTSTPAAPPDPTMTIIGTGVGTGIAIIIAVAVVGILLLRKRP
jgi:outer membrane protein assembly factor BamB